MSVIALKEVLETALWVEHIRGDKGSARERLLELYAPLARSIAGRMYRRRIDDAVPFADYLQYGHVGLLEAIDRYDSSREVSFGTFSSQRIRGAILNGLARESEQAAQHQFWRRRSEARVESLRTAVAPDADRASFAEIIAITAGLVVGALLDDSRESIDLADRNPQNDPYAANEMRQLHHSIIHLMAQLPDKERIVAQGHYVNGREFDALAVQLGLSKGRISQLHAQALLRLRHWLDGEPRLDRKV